MIIFITGPSGVGKSTLRDYYCKTYSLIPTPAFTTRKNRVGEVEIHRTVSEAVFNEMVTNNKLCLIANNHGFNYGYSIAELEQKSCELILFEVDSSTAIREKEILNAIIVRIIPSNIKIAIKEIKNKRDDSNDRTKDLLLQMDKSFIDERNTKGDYIFVNSYDQSSLKEFVIFIDKIVDDTKK